MQSQNRLLDDLTQLFTSAVSAAQGVREEAETQFRHQLEKIMADFDFVHRDEFEAVRLMAQKAREENAELAARIAKLEDASGTSEDSTPAH